jgi:RNA polymerase sigma factor (sigma-70 family)
MIDRQTIPDLFSTFLQFTDDRFSHWVTDGRLRRNVRRCLSEVAASDSPSENISKASRETSESFWVLYWHNRWQQVVDPLENAPLATGHLAAYLQEACYWAAQQVIRNLASSQSQFQIPVSDCVQMAIVELPKILKDYHSKQGASLKTYASLCFRNAIRDRLRQQREADGRTDWGLLRKLSQKRLTEVLQMAGLSAVTIARYQLAWTCFKTYCAPRDTPSDRQLAAPDRDTWTAIAQLYNRQRHQFAEIPPEAKPEDLEQWLKYTAKQTRSALYPNLTSLNLSLDRGQEGGGEVQDTLTDEQADFPMAALLLAEEVQERQGRQAQVSDLLTQSLAQLKPEVQTLLQLYYGEELTQQQMATQLETKQYTVSRRLSNVKSTLLLKLAQWSQDTWHISLTSTAVKDMSVVLEEWLQAHYRKASHHSPEDIL